MKHYAIATATVTDESWTQEYTEQVTKLVEQFGGKYIVRTSDITVIEGDAAPQVLVVMEFPSKETFETFYHSDAYKPFLEARKSGAVGQFYLVPVNDDAAS